MTRILVTGSRHWTDQGAISSAIRIAVEWLGSPPIDSIVLVHGGASGADAIAYACADYAGIASEMHPADWNTHGRRAGPIRNQEMVDAGADILLACPLPDSKGTWDCMQRACKAGIPIYIVNPRSQK